MQRRSFFQAAGAAAAGSVAAAGLMQVELPASADDRAAADANAPSGAGLDFHTFREYPGRRGPKTMLFWDYWKLHHFDNLELVPGVPTLVPDSAYIDPFTKGHGTGRVFFDRPSGKWRKIWGTDAYFVAESDDGLHWRPADMPEVQPAGGKQAPHHVFSLPKGSDSIGWLYLDPVAADGYPYKIPVIQKDRIVYDRAKADSKHRWHALTQRFDKPRLHMFDHLVMVSKDGLRWEERTDYDWGGGRIVPEEPQYMFYNHLTGEQSLICRPGLGDRRVVLTTTRDFRTWSEPQLVQAPDLLDGGIVEFYTMPTFAYGQYFVGFVWASHFATSAGPDAVVLHKGPQAVHLALSTDGRYFTRPTRRHFIPFAEPGELGCHSLRTDGMVVLDDEIRFYTEAGLSAHGTPVPRDRKEADRACVVHRLRRDGFFYFQSKGFKAEFTTRPLALFDPVVTVNAQAPTGEVQFEMRDEKNRPVEGYTFDECRPLRFADDLRFPLQWNNRPNLGELVGKCVRIAVRFHNARIYSFRADYHIVDAWDVRRMADDLPIDTTRFGA